MIQVRECTPLGKGKLLFRFDNGTELTLYRKEAASFQLAQDAFISEEDYGHLLSDVVGKRAKKRALYLLEQMDRTEHQLREKLEQGGYPQECVDNAVEYVKRFHYLDDYRYACSFVRYSMEKYSRQQLKMKLLQKGIDRELIEQALEQEYTQDEKEQIRRLLVKRRYEPQCGEKEFTRTYQYLLRRGFRNSDILSAMKYEEG